MGKHYGDDVFTERSRTRKRRARGQAEAIGRVRDAESRKVVGWLYRWDTGHMAVMWMGERCGNVVYD